MLFSFNLSACSHFRTKKRTDLWHCSQSLWELRVNLQGHYDIQSINLSVIQQKHTNGVSFTQKLCFVLIWPYIGFNHKDIQSSGGLVVIWVWKVKVSFLVCTTWERCEGGRWLFIFLNLITILPSFIWSQ